MRRWATGARAVVLGSALVCAGCASVAAPLAHLTTERAVGQSFANLYHQPGLSVQLSLGVDGQQLDRLTQILDHGAPAADLSPSDAAALAAVPKASIEVQIRSADGRPLSTHLGATDGAAVDEDFALRVGASQPVELRSIGTTLYGRLDLPALAADFGQPPAVAQQAEQTIAGLAARVPGLAPLAHGGWVSADVASLYAPGAHSPSLPASTVSQLAGGLRNALQDNASFANSGTHSGRTEYTITLRVAGFAKQFYGSVETALGSDQSLAPILKLLAGPVDRIPATTHVTVQEWVKGDKAEEIDLDLAQFDHAIAFPVPLRLVLGTASPVAAPAGASRVDLSQLAPLLRTFPGLGGTDLAPAQTSTLTPA